MPSDGCHEMMRKNPHPQPTINVGHKSYWSSSGVPPRDWTHPYLHMHLDPVESKNPNMLNLMAIGVDIKFLVVQLAAPHVDVNYHQTCFYMATRGLLLPPFLPFHTSTFTSLLLHLFWWPTGARGEVGVCVAVLD
ncbi:hypothetical protein Taro_048025 [Colocasia esculenta]|uniref:Uncharacterized protein n=1 Tax=Colocasia esculenta TaxID=4460 RepID=A0A843WXF3_COLES|nr:hypothetical protein [Colocasia esculenta]